jgi:hypothetical protein
MLLNPLVTPSVIAIELRLFMRHKKWLLILALSSLLLGIIEQSQVGWTAETLADFELNGRTSYFFYANLISLLVWLYVVLKLMSERSGIRQASVAGALLKGCITYFGWLSLLLWALYKLVVMLLPDITTPALFFHLLGQQSPWLLWLMVALLLFTFAYLQSVAIITMAGSIISKYFNPNARMLPAIAAWHLPLNALLISVRMPAICLCLLTVLAFKLFSGWLSVLGLPFIHLISEPLSQLGFLFSVHLAYSLCVDPHLAPAYQQHAKPQSTANKVQLNRF